MRVYTRAAAGGGDEEGPVCDAVREIVGAGCEHIKIDDVLEFVIEVRGARSIWNGRRGKGGPGTAVSEETESTIESELGECARQCDFKRHILSSQ